MIDDVLSVVNGCIRGEEQAWNIFVREFGSMAENILRKFSDFSPDEREAIIQNAFIKLFKGGLIHFQGKSKYEFFKYFKTIIINEGITYIKLRTEDRKRVSLDAEDPEGFSLKELIPDPSSQSRPDLMAEKREKLEMIRKVVEGFPLLDQQVFFLKIQGHKDEEIAELLNIVSGTVASKYSRIKEKITDHLGEF